MKLKLIITIVALFSFSTIKAQTELWGMTSEGGDYGVGTIYKTDANGDNFEVQHSFFKYVGETNQSALTETTNGKLYGVASEGTVCDETNRSNSGVIYEYDINTGKYHVIHAFKGKSNGQYPRGKLVYATNGKLYGVATRGGLDDFDSGKGVIFEFDLSTNTYTKLVDFDGTNGKYPSSLMQAKDGKLYGTTGYGGADDKGVIFSYDIENSLYNVLYEFTGGDDGNSPSGAFVETSEGILYGVTSSGGSNNYGTIYEFNIATSVKTIKENLSIYTQDVGGSPSGLVMNSNGKLYVTTHYYNKQEYIYEYDISTETFTKKHTIYSSSGTMPIKTLFSDGSKLYGVTSDLGSYSSGSIFEYNIDDDTFTTIHSFDRNDIHNGYFPNASLIIASNGKIYSTTNSGGRSTSYFDGVFYEFDLTSDTYTTLFSFEDSPMGANPKGGLIQAENKKLYGLTNQGGINSAEHSSGMGTLFEYNPSSQELNVLVKLDETKGVVPQGNLLQANNGKLYGLTYQGGTTNWGTLFEYDIETDTYIVKYNFDINGDRANGANPTGTLMQADNGKLYGFTSRGGVLNGTTSVDNGTIFEYDTENSTLTTIHTFNETDGKAPYSKLIQAQNGILYGLTPKGGGYGKRGTLFKYDLSTGELSSLYSFSETEGYAPYGALTEVVTEVDGSDDIINELYGVASGKSGNNDVIFKYNIDTDAIEFVKNFEGNNYGSYLTTTFLLASNGNLYGAGPIDDTDYKYLAQYNIVDNTLESKKDFTCKKYTGTPLYVGELIEIDANYLSVEKHKDILEESSHVYPNPTTGQISINSDVEISSLEIYNQMGQLVLSNLEKKSIDISNLKAGIYIVKSSDKKGMVRTQKIIKK